MTKWLPPSERPWNETAGYLGYYTRTHLPTVFDLVDCDGASPPFWLYYQDTGRTFRLIEEKPNGQDIHKSQIRVFGVVASLLALGIAQGLCSSKSGVYVIHDAEQLVEPRFPLKVERRFPDRTSRMMTREHFDRWLLLDEADSVAAAA
jgi:hypothetical protein